MASSSTKLGVALVLPLIALELLVSLYPIGYSLWLSFHNVNILAKTSNFIGFGNYASIPSDFFIASAAAVSARFIAETTLLVVALSMGMALVLNEKIRGLSVLKVIVILPWALSEFAIAITGRFFLDSNYGFLNALLLHLGIYKHSFVFLSSANSVEWISLFYTWNFAPIGAFFILSALQTVPDELYKAAKIDGASTITRFRLVTFPFIKYAVLITLVLATIQSGGAVVIFFALTGGGPGVSSTPVTLYDFRVFFNYAEYGYGAAISWVTLVFIASATTTYFYLLTRRKK
jgi:ABC-type sugar transport system permease subunit